MAVIGREGAVVERWPFLEGTQYMYLLLKDLKPIFVDLV